MRAHRALAVAALLAAVTSAAAGLPALSPDGAQGDPIVVRGRVLAADGAPVAGAEVFAYHADADGRYHDDAFRGTVRTDDQGRYAFRTTRPGGYGPAPHVHFRVRVSGHEPVEPTLRLTDTASRTVTIDGVEASEYVYDIRLR